MTTIHNLNTLGWMNIQQMIIKQSLQTIHRIHIDQEPKALAQYTHRPPHREQMDRKAKKLSMQYMFKTKKCKNSFFHRSIYIYNNITDDTNNMNKKQFKVFIKKYIPNNYDIKQIPKIPDKQ